MAIKTVSSTFVLFVLAIFGLSSLSWGAPTGVWPQLMAKAKNQDIQVIIQLHDSDSFNKNLSTRKAQTRRILKVDSLQNELLSTLTSQGHQPKNVKKFSYMPFIALSVNSATLSALQANPSVAGIEEDVMYRANLSESNPLVGGDTVFNDGYTGAGQTIAILDTGVDKTHSFFGGRVVSEACYSTNNPLQSLTSVCPGGVEQSTALNSGLNCDALDPTLSASGCDHGTHVAGIAAGNGASFNGIARDADLIAIQVFSKLSNFLLCFPFSSPCVVANQSDILLAGERVLTLSSTMNIASVNLSLGGPAFASTCDASLPSEKILFDNLRAQGIAPVVASGNSGLDNSIGSPACVSSAISVGSTTKSDVISSFSNTASFLSLLAPGGAINSSVPGNTFDIFSGTSMATPHVSGTWAVIKQAALANGAGSSVTEILSALQSTGIPVTHPTNGLTFPRIQIDVAIDSLIAGSLQVLNDFDANQQSDLLGYNTISNEIGQAFIENAAIQTMGILTTLDPLAGWTVQATGDFDGDKNVDLLLINSNTNELAVALLNGATILSSGIILDLTATGLTLHGTGDFDADGKTDVLLFNPTTGETEALIMDGVTSVLSSSITTVDVGNNWDLIDNGDFNGDNFSDLLLYNTVSGEITVALWDGSLATLESVTTLPPASNRVVADTADFNGDGNSDLWVLNTVTGDASVISVNSSGILSETPAFPVDLAGGWSFINAGNYNGDNFADYLLLNTAGDIRAVLLDNGVFISQHDLLTLDLPGGWTLLSGKP